MQTKKLQIIGLGRCIIGHLAKTLNAHYSDQLVFQHHYLLNYTTCLYSSYTKEDISLINNIHSTPSVSEQIRCLEELKNYDICALELFPPSKLYKHKSIDIYTCFESFTNELKDLGFYKHFGNAQEFTKDSYNYGVSIKKLIKKIKSINENIKIILVNGELVQDESRPNIGSQLIFEILQNIKSSTILDDSSVELLDINDLITSLEKKQKTYYEVAFPYLYLNHTQELLVKKIARDCKHTTSYIRINFLKEFSSIIKNFDHKAPLIETDNKTIIFKGKTFQQRANLYLESKADSNLNDAKELSLFISYTLETNHEVSKNIIYKFIIQFSHLHPLNPEDLKDSFYHMRTLCAYIHASKTSVFQELIHINLTILNFKTDEVKPFTNFALLWITNIYLASVSIINTKNIQEMKLFNKFLTILSQNPHYTNHASIERIISSKLV